MGVFDSVQADQGEQCRGGCGDGEDDEGLGEAVAQCLQGELVGPAVLSATAPARTGRKAKPRSRCKLVVALAMPARCSGTVFRETLVVELRGRGPEVVRRADADVGFDQRLIFRPRSAV